MDDIIFIEEIPSNRISLDCFNAQDGDSKVYESVEGIDDEIHSLSKELDDISIDKIPFSKTDIIFAVVSGIIGAAFDAVAFLGNSSDNIIGQKGDSIHENPNLNHSNNPLDYQGGFDKEGNPVLNGSGVKRDISFGGGKHRGLTEGHDIFRKEEAIKQYQEGKFKDGAFIDGKYIRVTSDVNQNGKKYIPIPDYKEAKKAYNKHMWADFWSTSSLPLPGTSSIREYCTDENIKKIIDFFIKVAKPFAGKIIPMSAYENLCRMNNADWGHEVRSYIQKLYSEGLNLRSEVGKGFAFAIPEITIQVYVWIAYKIIPKKKNEEIYSKEAIEQHRHLLLLISHSIVAAVNLGIAIGCENPTHLNFATLLRVFNLALSSIKDEFNYNNRVLSKVSLDLVKVRLFEQKTIIAFANGFVETVNYQSFCYSFVDQFNKYLSQREFNAGYLELLLEEQKDVIDKNNERKINIENELECLVDNIKIQIYPEDSLETLVQNSFVDDNQIDGMNIDEYCIN